VQPSIHEEFFVSSFFSKEEQAAFERMFDDFNNAPLQLRNFSTCNTDRSGAQERKDMLGSDPYKALREAIMNGPAYRLAHEDVDVPDPGRLATAAYATRTDSSQNTSCAS